MNNFLDLINEAVNFYYKSVVEDYDDISSFAIVTDEGFECFQIAVNRNRFFADLINEDSEDVLDWCDEDFWNTGYWSYEDLTPIYNFPKMNDISNILEQNSLTDDFLCHTFLNALMKIRDKDNKDICMFVHKTDSSFDERLFEIVKKLNGDEVAESYREYYDS
ncbi:MAG: hypothetical protein Q4C98_05050 [Capnocytophaga sp.]|nr:hypothetical protein [Capnocytophaga sp.]